MLDINFKRGIFAIINDKINKIYIDSSNDIMNTWNDYNNLLNNNKFKINLSLQHDWKKQKGLNFSLVAIEDCTLLSDNDMLKRKIYWSKKYKSNNKYQKYNICIINNTTKNLTLKNKDIQNKYCDKYMQHMFNEMPEIITIYKKYTLKINNKRYELLYKILQYKKLKNQDKKYSDNLKKQGVKIKYFNTKGIRNMKWSIKYIPYSEKIYGIQYRYQRINSILDKQLEEGITLREKIESEWYNINAHKNKNDNLKDSNSIILDILATYFLIDVNKLNNNNIMTGKDFNLIQKFETNFEKIEKEKMISQDIVIESVDTIDAKKQEIINKEQEQKQGKKWQNSRSYRINNIYSYNNHKDTKTYFNWILNKECTYNILYHHKFTRTIDPERHYIAQWCIVDTNNIFNFNGKYYQINKSLNQYKVKNDNDCLMDKILVYQQDNNIYYYDQDIYEIDSSKIIEIGENNEFENSETL